MSENQKWNDVLAETDALAQRYQPISITVPDARVPGVPSVAFMTKKEVYMIQTGALPVMN